MGFGAWVLPVGLWQGETILVDRRDFVRGCRRSHGEVRGVVGGGVVVWEEGFGVGKCGHGGRCDGGTYMCRVFRIFAILMDWIRVDFSRSVRPLLTDCKS